MNTTIAKAITMGKSINVTVQPWGGDMVRFGGLGLIMSGADAVAWLIQAGAPRV